MKASLQQRLEYVTAQLLQARMTFRIAAKHATTAPIKSVFAVVDARLEKVSRVLNGAEPPLGKRNAVDLEAAVADPMDD